MKRGSAVDSLRTSFVVQTRSYPFLSNERTEFRIKQKSPFKGNVAPFILRDKTHKSAFCMRAGSRTGLGSDWCSHLASKGGSFPRVGSFLTDSLSTRWNRLAPILRSSGERFLEGDSTSSDWSHSLGRDRQCTLLGRC